MATSYGVKMGRRSAKDVHVPFEERIGALMPYNRIAAMLEKDMAPCIGGGFGWNATDWTVTTGGTGDSIAAATTGGILITAASDDNFDTTIDSVLAYTPTTGRWYAMLSRIAVSDATGIGFKLGLTTGGGVAALPFGTNYTDVVAISKAIASANVLGTARGNSGTAADTATIGTAVAATEMRVGFAFYLHATSPQGYWFIDDTATVFTANQLTQVSAILTTPPTMYATMHVTGVTATNPTLGVRSFMFGADR